MTPDFSTLRAAMIDSQLRTVGVNEPSVLAAIAATPREKFVPKSRTALAYVDAEITIAPGRQLLPPMIHGLLLTHLRVAAGENVLVVGAGTGYLAAVVAALGADVTALECDATLAATANAAGVATVAGQLTEGWASAAPYDAILIDGAVSFLPPALLAQLREGGRLAAVIIGSDGVGRITVGRVAGGFFGGAAVFEATSPVLPGFEAPKQFVF